MNSFVPRAFCFVLAALLFLLPACSPRQTPPAVTETAVTPDAPAPTPTAPAPVASAVSSAAASNPDAAMDAPAKLPKEAVQKMQHYTAPAPAVSLSLAPGEYRYNTNLDIENNVFLDALIYTGYNIQKHRADGNMWKYILSSEKRGLGYLSNITFGGGCTGYETTPDGRPDIAAFERGGLVCASFATYVYFNYLPNVAGIDTSCLPRPERSYNAHSFYEALQKWEQLGYSHRIGFTAENRGGYIDFHPQSEIPIGSVLVFCDARKMNGMGSHIVIYAGTKNGYHWVFQVGNKNGPEFCAVERFLFGPDPQWPIAIFSTPSNIRMAAQLTVQAVDEAGAPVAGVALRLQNAKTGETFSLGATNAKGEAQKEGLAYGDYRLSWQPPAGYRCSAASRTLHLTTAHNSQNTARLTFVKPAASAAPSKPKPSAPVSSQPPPSVPASDPQSPGEPTQSPVESDLLSDPASSGGEPASEPESSPPSAPTAPSSSPDDAAESRPAPPVQPEAES